MVATGTPAATVEHQEWGQSMNPGEVSGADDPSLEERPIRSVEIKAVEDDGIDRLPLWNGYRSFHEVEILETSTMTTWARFPDPAEPMHAALAVAREPAFGLAHWLYHRSAWTTDDYGYLQDLFVETGARGFGVGRALIGHVTADARHCGGRVRWSTHETNEDAMQLYDRIADRSGFIQRRWLLTRHAARARPQGVAGRTRAARDHDPGDDRASPSSGGRSARRSGGSGFQLPEVICPTSTG